MVAMILVIWTAAGSVQTDFRQPGSQRRAVEGDPVPAPVDPVVPAPPAPDPRETKRSETLQAARKFGLAGNHAEALKHARAAQALRPDPAIADWIVRLEAAILSDRGWKALEQGDRAGAATLLRRAASAYPNVLSPENMRFLAGLEYQQARLKEVEAREREERERLARNRPEAERLNREAAELLRQGKDQEALERSIQALNLAPKDEQFSIVYWAASGRLAHQEGRLEDAIQAYQATVNLDPENQEARRALDALKAIRDEHAKSLAPRLPAAFERLTEAAQPLPHADPSVVDARVSRERKGPRLPEEVERSPGYPEAQKAINALVDKDWVLSLALFKAALAKDPGNAALKRAVDLASYMVERPKAPVPVKEPSLAPWYEKASIEQIMDRLDSMMMEEMIFDTSCNLAFDLWKRGERKDAIRLMTQAVQDRPNNLIYRRALRDMTEADASKSGVPLKMRCQFTWE